MSTRRPLSALQVDALRRLRDHAEGHAKASGGWCYTPIYNHHRVVVTSLGTVSSLVRRGLLEEDLDNYTRVRITDAGRVALKEREGA